MAAQKYHSVVQKRITECKNPACGKVNPAANKMRTNDSWRSTAWILQPFFFSKFCFGDPGILLRRHIFLQIQLIVMKGKNVFLKKVGLVGTKIGFG